MGGSSAAVASSSQMETVTSSSRQHLECPFCQFHDENEYVLLLHIEALHTDDSPFVVKDDPTNTGLTGSLTSSLGPGNFDQLDYEFGSRTEDDEETMYVLCPESGCEEPVLLIELQTHLDFHEAEQISMEDVRHAGGEDTSSRSSGSSSGGSGGNSPWERDERANMASNRGSTEKRGETEGGGSRSSASVKREKRENRTLVISRDGVISRESMVLRDGHKERASQRERDNMLEREREKEREKDRGRDRHHDMDNRGRRIIYADPGPSPPPSVVSSRHSHKSPKRFYKTAFTAVGFSLSPDKESKRHEKPPARSNTGVPYKSSGVKRLGKSDLGPYAHEHQMPDWLRKELEKGGKVSIQTTIDGATGTLVKDISVSNETPNLLPVIALLCERDHNVARAWLCHPGVKHVGKQIKGEGGFCGYRNIQMIISYIQAAFPRGGHPFEGRIPSILRLQDWIEEGWDKGINLNARLETGGIKGTRKYIGTSEAQTMFASLGISCRPYPFNKSDGLQTQHRLLDFVENYFKASTPEGPLNPKVARTNKPPIYFQHSGHSMTIVGIEKTLDGMRNLLVFDPFFTPSAPMKNLIGVRPVKGRLDSEMLLRAYRRKMNYLQKYKEFELIILEV